VVDGIIFSDSGGVLAGAGDYVGSVVDGIIFSDSGGVLAGAGDYVGSGIDGSDEEIAAAALLLGLL
jgi:hypothetical protein